MNDSSTCLVECRSHSSSEPIQSNTLSPEIVSYFLTRRTVNTQSHETVAPHRNIDGPDSETVSTPHRKRHERVWSSERSPKYPNSGKSEHSRSSRRKKGGSVGSLLSESTRHRNIREWSAGVKTASPPSFNSYQSHPVDPPRAPRPGYEWVWFPEGYWAEREIPSHMNKRKWWNRSRGQKSQTSQQSHEPTKLRNEDKDADKTLQSFALPRIKIGSISLKSTAKNSRRTSEFTSMNESQKSSNIFPFNFTKSAEECRQVVQRRDGLYCRTKRNIEARFRKRVRIWSVQTRQH